MCGVYETVSIVGKETKVERHTVECDKNHLAVRSSSVPIISLLRRDLVVRRRVSLRGLLANLATKAIMVTLLQYVLTVN